MTPTTYDTDERKARRISLFITALLLGILSVIAYIWVIFRGTIPPEDENPYVVVGQFDFGQGLPSGGSAPAQVRTSVTPPAEEPVLTSPEPAPVKAPTPKSPAPNPTPQPTETEEDEEVERFTQGQGQTTDTGEGEIGAGMFEFGEGEEGLQNRKLLEYVLPRYTVQKEGRIKYELYILPDGRVERVRALTPGAAPELKRAGEEAILQWRFSPISGNQVQRVTVTIRFRLR
jgi:TonB family protein